MTQFNAKKQLGHGINYEFVNSFTIQSILSFLLCHFVSWVPIYCHFHVNMILAKWSLFHGCLTLATWNLSPLSHFVFGTFNHNRVTSVTTRDVFGAMIFVLVANFSYFVKYDVKYIFTKIHYFCKIKKLKEKTLLKGVTPSLLLYYVLGNHAFEKKQSTLRSSRWKAEFVLSHYFICIYHNLELMFSTK